MIWEVTATDDGTRVDGHFGNMRAAGDRIYLPDFGLATSPRFDLSDAWRRDRRERPRALDSD
jgi:hypothetical protein